MSKRCPKENEAFLVDNSGTESVNSHKIDQKSLINSVVGFSNVKRWNELKQASSCKSNEEFVKLLLDIAQEHITSNAFKCTRDDSNNETNGDCKKQLPLSSKKRDKTKQNILTKNETKQMEICTAIENSNLVSNFINDNVSPLIINIENEASKNSIDQTNDHKQLAVLNSVIDITKSKCEAAPTDLILRNDVNTVQIKTNGNSIKCDKSRKKKELSLNSEKVSRKQKCIDKRSDKLRRKQEIDIRKAPEFNIQTECNEIIENIDINIKSEEDLDNNRVAIKIKLCNNCNTRHTQDHCPIQTPLFIVLDTVCYEEWKEKYKEMDGNVENSTIKFEQSETSDEENSNKFTFAYLSLPQMLFFKNTNSAHGLGVYSKNDIKQFTQFGPLLGKFVKEVDIPEDSTMRDLWDIHSEATHSYINTENHEESNWIRFIRPAPSRDARNMLAVSKNNQLFFITTKPVTSGEELLYWQDDLANSNKKKMEKTSCGGCNMNFAHPLYYRIHCSIFHDIRYSLTIRKYHCKVCGAAVLGKENIMKHAAELHNGQGAYQCQFCKKFFLRLNYLEMHRTYGCSANPHRSRPLCDFCGRKFCQPQKLKVHIKRMHSDMSEVLKEFQCKSCLKILGSRAALQRHLKEVHQKQVDGACACSRCGKLFQNKSNLKIHMLTHSGIKPFKCAEKNCIAAFTTKQCLQFHYKKVHGLSEDLMPKIERSVDYTFEAYSGNQDDQEPDINKKTDLKCSSNISETDESLDEKNLDDPPALQSPLPLQASDHSVGSTQSPPMLEAYTPNMKILSKGSKKWIGEEPLQILKSDMYQIGKNRECKSEDSVNNTNIILDVEESQTYEPPKLSTNLSAFTRHESSNASLLVEAALDSVCSEPNIEIDVNSTTNCTDTLVNNLYTLSHADTLPDVTYSHSVDMNDSRDINLISPSVNDHISVTDDINDELRHGQNIGLDYSSFHQDDFSPPNSPGVQNRNNFVRDYINVNVDSPPNPQSYDAIQSKRVSPVPSPPRYSFSHNVNAEHISSDDSNGIGVQNLSIHNAKDSIQLDLSIYKSHYNLDPSNFQLRKDFRIKFDTDVDRKQVYILDVDGVSKSYNDEQKFNISVDSDHNQVDNIESNDLNDKNFENMSNQDIKHKDINEETRINLSDIRSKFDLDLDLRTKTYENIEAEIRSRNPYDGTVDDFRIKSYDLIDSIDSRNNLDTRTLLDSDFRPDRNFEHLVLNSSELQGLDMSARSYHNYSNLNRYHHLYSEVDRASVDLRLNYSPPPPSYTHADILRVVSLDLTSPGRHSVDLSLRSHQIANSRLLTEHSIQPNPHRLTLDQGRILASDLGTTRHLNPDTRLLSVSEMSNRILSDHTTSRLLTADNTNRLITSDQRIISDETRLMTDQPRLLEQGRILGDGRILPPAPNNGTISPVPYSGYSVSSSPYHPTPLAPRPHVSSPNATPYHHYSTYY